MKTKTILTTTLGALLPLAAFAQTSPANSIPSVAPVPAVAPAPAAPAAPAAPGAPARMRHDERAKEPVTFLGVETSNVSRAMSEQLGLPRGFGLVVDYVVPETGAAAAGLQESDILKMLNDQILMEPEQLGKLVRSYPDGTNVNLTVLRKGQELKLPVTLKKRQPKPGHGPYGENDWDFNFDGFDNFKDMHIPDMSAVREAVARAKKEAVRAGDEARRAARRLRVVTTDNDTVRASHYDLGKAQIVFSDEKGELKLETVNGKKMLTAKDPSGKVLFNGPIDTEQERAHIPTEVRERYEVLEDQDLPAVPPAPVIAPEPPEPPNGGESAQLRPGQMERACLTPNNRVGWVRSTIL